MALADSVPGVSGGTIAFILGFYDDLLRALHGLFGRDRSVRQQSLRALLRFGAGWTAGMIACILVLAELFELHIYFMCSLFLGLSAAAFPLVLRAERSALRNAARCAPLALLGAALTVGLTLLRADTAVSLRVADPRMAAFVPVHFRCGGRQCDDPAGDLWVGAAFDCGGLSACDARTAAAAAA